MLIVFQIMYIKHNDQMLLLLKTAKKLEKIKSRFIDQKTKQA